MIIKKMPHAKIGQKQYVHVLVRIPEDLKSRLVKYMEKTGLYESQVIRSALGEIGQGTHSLRLDKSGPQRKFKKGASMQMSNCHFFLKGQAELRCKLEGESLPSALRGEFYHIVETEGF